MRDDRLNDLIEKVNAYAAMRGLLARERQAERQRIFQESILVFPRIFQTHPDYADSSARDEMVA